MIGHLNPDDKNVTIIGAGYAGLIAAYALLQQGWQVTIHEKSDRAGGLIQTLETQFGIVETAAHSFRTSAGLVKLCAELDVPLVKSKTKKKYILRNGLPKPYPLTIPETLHAIIKALSPVHAANDQTMAGWARAHLGQTALDYLITPMTKGIYACAPDQLDQALAFPNLSVTSKKSLIGHLLRKRRQGVIAAEMAAPERGMASLIEKLVRAIENNSGAKIIYHSSVTELPQGNVILACDSKAAAQLLKSDKLAKITYNPMVTATIFYDEKHIRPVDGVGVLYSAHEKRRSLGILFNSSTFDRRATKGFSSFTMMLGGYGQEALLNENDQALHVIIENEMREVLGIAAKPLAIYLTRWPQAIPVYNAELKHILETMTLPTGLALTGNYTGEVSLRGMTDRWIAKTSRSFKV